MSTEKIMDVVERCLMASDLNPSQWTEEILWFIPNQPVSIFGYQQVAMDRKKTIKLIEALIWTELCSSLGDARKAIKGNGIRVNRKIITDFNYVLSEKDALPNIDAIVLEFGKYNFGIIEMC